MRQIDRAQFEAGLAAYRRGASLLEVAIKSMEDMNRLDADPEAQKNWRAAEEANKSYLLGFASGLVDDIRKVASGTRPGGVRA